MKNLLDYSTKTIQWNASYKDNSAAIKAESTELNEIHFTATNEIHINDLLLMNTSVRFILCVGQTLGNQKTLQITSLLFFGISQLICMHATGYYFVGFFPSLL